MDYFGICFLLYIQSSTCLELAEVCKEVGLPPGVLNILTGSGTEAGAPLASHPHVDKVRFLRPGFEIDMQLR